MQRDFEVASAGQAEVARAISTHCAGASGSSAVNQSQALGGRSGPATSRPASLGNVASKWLSANIAGARRPWPKESAWAAQPPAMPQFEGPPQQQHPVPQSTEVAGVTWRASRTKKGFSCAVVKESCAAGANSFFAEWFAVEAKEADVEDVVP